MRIELLGIALFAFVTTTNAQNSCSTAQSIMPGIYFVPGIDGPEAPSPLCVNTGVATGAEWYSFTPAQDTAILLTTDIEGLPDTRFHVFTGACGSLTCVAGDDDSGPGLTSRASFNVTGGVTYRIAFDDRWYAGSFGFQLQLIAPVVPAEGIVTWTSSAIPNLLGGDCVVDMNGDDLDDMVRASSTNINIQYQQPGGGFLSVNIPTTPADHSPSWSIVAGDIDGNGFTDLMYGGQQGATFMMANETGTAFTEVSFSQYIFCQRTNMVDLNADGHLDAFSCHDTNANVRFLNDGTGNLTFMQGGLGETCGNYGSIWTDYDNDGDVDCFVAKCGCDPTDLLMRNNGDGTFTNMAPALGLADSHQSWSSAWGDFDNDGDMDMLIGSSSSNYHKLMSNNGDGTFSNETAGSGFDNFSGQSIEWTTHDFNNDGYLDVLGGGALMYGNGHMQFAPDVTAPSTNAVGDLNNDGFLDIANWGGAFLNDGNDNNWLKVLTKGTVSNKDGIGARVRITSALGSQIRDVKSGDAFSTMSSLNTHFGVGQNTVVDELEIRWPSGIVDILENVPVNTVVEVVEGLSTSIATNVQRNGMRVYPNPVADQLRVELPATSGKRFAAVYDITGKQVIVDVLFDNQLDVSILTNGTYILKVKQDGRAFQSVFTKE
ncbi:MAG: VCBS repeat-containing protein [Flavobacteriales bacterium]|nr:VCBS repeat-containing protein [Flavobacteriales bacterium]MBK6881733.1 VCBS repeat-containing protein [Flavobacteriales bacterium]MBK7102616.1 VCBS repeat-containing protein [Flavobacteriales bacterium]MBK8530714.1 VCBS repeat-containing protein [Flavobacteriales bacterium]MBK8709907.1 VCBS repeat-containing protein [Flavobacteriales bacterium]